MNPSFPEYAHCMLCPRNCGVNRYEAASGYCRSTAEMHVASVCIHKGEEPVIGGLHGICNVFFSHCNLQCMYCQNDQISDNKISAVNKFNDSEALTREIIRFLEQGCKAVGFVSPTHFSPHIKDLISKLNQRRFHPVIVYNTNAYEKVDVLKGLEDYVDIYLPDLKYNKAETGNSYSDVSDYPEMAKAAIKEMFRQKGATLRMEDEHQAASGLIVRHLVLPGHADESIRLLEWLADECSPRIHLSLMSQYLPTAKVAGHKIIGQPLLQKDYENVVQVAEKLGFIYGWKQAFSSQHIYIPDFKNENPFEN